jgi:DASH complex subunit DAM1
MATPRRPRTPIRRISRGSLRALSLSASRDSQYPSADPLAHLAPLITELRDQFDDLAANFDALDHVNESLDGFNEAFASYLYGLKINAYTGVFDQVMSTFTSAPCDWTRP